MSYSSDLDTYAEYIKQNGLPAVEGVQNATSQASQGADIFTNLLTDLMDKLLSKCSSDQERERYSSALFTSVLRRALLSETIKSVYNNPNNNFSLFEKRAINQDTHLTETLSIFNQKAQDNLDFAHSVVGGILYGYNVLCEEFKVRK